VNVYIYAFLIFGFCFGLATFSCRHLFSEGPTKMDYAEAISSLTGRIYWALVCTFLWPVMILTGLNSVWVLAKKRKKSLNNC
jgi:hypothetical protein